MRFSSSPLFVAGVMSSPAWPLSGHVGQILLDVLCNIHLFWPGIFAISYPWQIVPFILIGMFPQKQQSLTIIFLSYDKHLQEMILKLLKLLYSLMPLWQGQGPCPCFICHMALGICSASNLWPTIGQRGNVLSLNCKNVSRIFPTLVFFYFLFMCGRTSTSVLQCSPILSLICVGSVLPLVFYL